MSASTYERLVDRYAAGPVPWDDPLPPPELIADVASRPAGRALDLGTGYGRAAIYLAGRGWAVDAVDFVPQAIDEARRRAAAAGVNVNFHLHPVTELDFLTPPYQLAVDVGCFHSLDRPGIAAYHRHLLRLLAPGARYLLFARLGDDTAPPPENAPRGVPESVIHDTFIPDFTLDHLEHGQTDSGDHAPWTSAWFWFTRL